MSIRIAFALVTSFVLFTDGAAAQAFGFGARIGTLGVGGELAVGLGEQVVARAGIGWNPWEPETSLDEIDVTAKLPTWYSAGLDLYLNGALRLGAGVLLKPDDPTLSAVFTQNQEIGGQTFTPQEIGTLVGVVDSKDHVPYVLVGFGKHTAAGSGLFLDIGVAFMGEPDFQLDAVDGSLSSQSGPLRDALDDEEQRFEDDAGAYLRFWPILNLGFRIGVG
ncbi:MAG: hypothetical protein AB7T31_12560 [Gemmatimonadales bacterium]